MWKYRGTKSQLHVSLTNEQKDNQHKEKKTYYTIAEEWVKIEDPGKTRNHPDDS